MGGSSKGGGGASTTFNFYGTMAGGVCAGPVDALVSIIMNGQEVWPMGTAWVAGNTIAAGTPYVFDAQTWVCTTPHVATTANAPGSGLEGWTEYNFARSSATYNDFSITDSQGVFWGVLRLYWGTQAQTVDYYLQAAHNTAGHQHPDYKGICYVVLIDFCFGQEIQSGPNVEIVVRRGANNQTIVVGGPAAITDGQVNLAAAAAEILTDQNCVGVDAGSVDSSSFQAAANYLDGASQQPIGAGSVLIDTSETLRSVFDRLTQMMDGYTRFNPNTKMIELGVYEHGVVPGSYTTLTADHLTARPKFKTTSWQGTYSRATVRYKSRQLNYQETSEKADDARAFFILKQVRETSLDRPYITRPAQAIAHGLETLRVVGHAQTTGELQVRREFGRGVRAGNYVYVDVDLEPGGAGIGQFFRVTSRKLPPTGPITIQLLADNTLAPVPWNSSTEPVLPTDAVVSPVASFRLVEVPTKLSGQRGAVVPLVQRPDNTITGCQLFFDTNPAGAFTSLGNFPGFAAKSTLHTAVTAGDATLDVDVDTTQPDANYFTNSYSGIEQNSDTMLAFIVSVVPSGGDAGQIAETAGYQIVEICSVGAQTLASAGRYTLSVLRGRQNTNATAFITANTEVWLIPLALVVPFNDANWPQIRANRILGLTPDHAQFRFCPFTFTSQLALSAATSEPFRFPLNSVSAPSLALTAPAWYAQTIGVAAYPYALPVSGTWSDPDGNVCEITVLLQKSTDVLPRLIYNSKFSSRASQPFSCTPQFDSPGSWTVKIIARDATNLTTEVDLAVVVNTVGGAVQTCANVDLFDCDGIQIVAGQNRFIPFGPITCRCTTAGATIQVTTSGLFVSGGTIIGPGAAFTYVDGTVMPFHGLIDPGSTGGVARTVQTSYLLTVWATKGGPISGWLDSPHKAFTIELFY